ncbi:hypothetical protein ATPR_1179 [Acetobacter tropicalis NBRC 101654]|uniref:Uncharacterized protein n=1 Tax=Acetobacter tropicalis NBRC 101654 TaxID=749388 RepID=F7VCT0_9PROT|nr:hypothetical protein ATPR_1179 [Acetobacter tropicalis NBRC 101654]
MAPKTCFPAEKTTLIDQTGSTLYSAIASGRLAGKRLQTSPPSFEQALRSAWNGERFACTVKRRR